MTQRCLLELGKKTLALALASALTLTPGLIPAAEAADAAKPERTSLQAMEVDQDGLKLKLTGPVKYNTFVTQNPPRLVLEVLNTEFAAATKVQEGKGKFLKRVRGGQFAGEPNPISRIVLDLNQAVTYRVALSGNDLVVKLEGAGAATADSGVPPAPAPKTEKGVVPPAAVPEAKPEVKAPEVKAPAKTEAKAETKPAETKPAAKPAEVKATPTETKPAEAKKAPEPRPAVAAAPPVEPKAPEVPVVAAKPKAPAPVIQLKKSDDGSEMPSEFSTGNSAELMGEGGTVATDRRDASPARVRASYSGTVTPATRNILGTLPRDPISLELDNTDVKDVLKMMAAKANVNMIYGSDVSGAIDLHLTRVPFYEAFNIVLSMNKLVATQVGNNILWISTLDALKNARSKAVGITRIFPLNYSVAEDVKGQIDAVRTAEGRTGNTVIDKKNNSVIVTESPDGLASVERLIAELDTRPKQVLIEAKLIEVKLGKDLHLGVQWDYFGAEKGKFLGQDGRNLYGSHFNKTPDPLVTDTGATPLFTQAGIKYLADSPGASGRGTGVSLPADKVFGAFTWGRMSNNFMLSATLTAAATQGKVKVLSDPKIATVNGKEAVIDITTQAPYVTTNVASTGVATQSVSFTATGIKLTVKPVINADGRISLEVNPKVSQPSATAAGNTATGAIAVDAREAKTNVIVKDGETIVIGGLITDSVSNQEAKVPLLGDIPIIGWLFKKKSIVRSRAELLVFVTTRILPD